MGNFVRTTGVFALLAGLIVLTPASPARAAGVVGTGSPASCTEAELDAALDAALAGGGLVTFNCGPGPLTIPLSGAKVISVDTQVHGNGLITLDAGNLGRHFRILSGASLEIRGLSLIRGRRSNGGSIRNDGGSVTIIDSLLSNNRADGPATNIGGAIYNNGGTLTISRSTLRDNSADNAGGAIASRDGSMITISNSSIINNSGRNGGGIDIRTSGSLEISNSTFSGNNAAGPNANRGGGVSAVGVDTTVSIVSTTFSGNRASNGGAGIRSNNASVTLRNTIIANSTTGSNCSGGMISQDYNLSDDGSCNLNQPNDLPNTDSNLGPLGDNHGPTETYRPQSGSLAIDSAACATSTDQRGVTRPQGPACDRGSVEVIVPVDLETLCVNFYTGGVLSPYSGQCGAGQWQIELPSPWPIAFCINPYTGQISYAFSGACLSPRTTHVIPDDGPLLVCWSRYTGTVRAVADANQCDFTVETLALIPAGR